MTDHQKYIDLERRVAELERLVLPRSITFLAGPDGTHISVSGKLSATNECPYIVGDQVAPFVIHANPDRNIGAQIEGGGTPPFSE